MFFHLTGGGDGDARFESLGQSPAMRSPQRQLNFDRGWE
jgi:hypothetical protein